MEEEIEGVLGRVGPAWILTLIGLIFIAGSLRDIRRGRTRASFKRTWDLLPQYTWVERVFTPIQFWIRVSILLVAGAVILGFGARMLLRG
ncbi:MAG TPA: hypothetical protein VNC50_01740 [Planctomycetia bacterium]|nr:hypothetical protein [Planctomycetia bacterium]